MYHEIKSIYSLKAILMLFIISLHSGVLFGDSQLYTTVFPVFRIGVPTFFMISGYFMFCTSLQDYYKHCKKAILKLIKLGMYGVSIYFLYYLVTHGYNYVHEIVSDCNSFVKWLCYGIPPLGAHLWYIFGYIYILLVSLLVFYSRKKTNLELWNVIFLILLLYLMITLFCHYYHEPSKITCNWLISGIPSFFVGWYIRQEGIESRCSIRYILPLTMFFLIITVLEGLFQKGKMGDLFYTTLPFSISTLLLFLKIKEKVNHVLYIIGKKYSMWMYIVHVMCIAITKHILLYLDLEPNLFVGLISLLFVFLLSIFFSSIFRFLYKPILQLG